MEMSWTNIEKRIDDYSDLPALECTVYQEARQERITKEQLERNVDSRFQVWFSSCSDRAD